MPLGLMEFSVDIPEQRIDRSDEQQNEKPEASLPKIIRFEELVVCGDEVWIQFQGQLYRLRRTKHDKLILTK